MFEVKLALFEMNGDGVSGLDGFSGHFFQFFWDVVSTDVVNSEHHFFLTDSLYNNINCPGADRIENFWPIALVNFQFKIITKILVDRLACIVKKIISPHQRGFIPDRSIADCVIVASEAINVLSKKCYAGSLALNIDIKNAFDTLEWSFLLQVLKQFGFNGKFCAWITEILHSARLSILINGKSVGFFGCAHGVRQGDSTQMFVQCVIGRKTVSHDPL
jgi:hypothetical protein